MKTSITEEMKFRQTVVEYAIKYNNNARATRRYKTSRQITEESFVTKENKRSHYLKKL